MMRAKLRQETQRLTIQPIHTSCNEDSKCWIHCRHLYYNNARCTTVLATHTLPHCRTPVSHILCDRNELPFHCYSSLRAFYSKASCLLDRYFVHSYQHSQSTIVSTYKGCIAGLRLKNETTVRTTTRIMLELYSKLCLP